MSSRMPISAVPRLVGAILAGVVVATIVGLTVNPAAAALVGIAVAGAIFVGTGWIVLWPMDAERTHRNARREDFKPLLEELTVTAAALFALAGVVTLIIGGSAQGKGSAAVALIGVFLSWGALHLMSARCAFLYYEGPDDTAGGGGIDFNSKAPPAYRDLFLLQLQPRNDLPGLGHRRVEFDRARSGTAPLPAVLCVRRGHSGHRGQSGRRRHRRLSECSVAGERGEPGPPRPHDLLARIFRDLVARVGGGLGADVRGWFWQPGTVLARVSSRVGAVPRAGSFRVAGTGGQWVSRVR